MANTSRTAPAMRRSRRASTRAGSSTTPPRPTLTKMQLAGRRSMVARSIRPAVWSVMGREITMASAWPASSARRSGPWTSSTHSGGGPWCAGTRPCACPAPCPAGPPRGRSRPARPGTGSAPTAPEGLADLRPGLGPLVGDQPGQVLGHGQEPEDGELGQRHGVDAAGGGDGDPLQRLGRQPGLAHLLAGPGAGGVDPAQPRQAGDRLGQALGRVAGDAEQHLGPVQQGPPAGLALGVARKAGSPRWSAG